MPSQGFVRYNQVHLSKNDKKCMALWHLLFKWFTYYLPLLVIIPYFSRKWVLLRAETSFFPNNLTFHIIILEEGYICRYIYIVYTVCMMVSMQTSNPREINRESSLRLYAFFDQDGNTAHTVWKEVRIYWQEGVSIVEFIILKICWYNRRTWLYTYVGDFLVS